MSGEVKDCTTCKSGAVSLLTPPCQGCEDFNAWAPVGAPDAHQRLLDDQRRLEWLLPAIAIADDPGRVGHHRTMALGAALMLGKTDRDAIDFAMEGSP